jgi:Ni,Fe-hydrogenase III component G
VTPLERISADLATVDAWSFRGGVHWLLTDASRIRDVAAIMNRLHARFVTITATELRGSGCFLLEYLWDLDGMLIGFPIQIDSPSVESIFDLCPAVDWIEREIHEGFAIDFAGRDYEPLLLRPGDKPGVNLREVPA